LTDVRRREDGRRLRRRRCGPWRKSRPGGTKEEEETEADRWAQQLFFISFNPRRSRIVRFDLEGRHGRESYIMPRQS
jgi:hypothetical protein